MKSREKSVKHIEDMRKELVELCSTSSNTVKISRAWEVMTGNIALHNSGGESIKCLSQGYIDILICNPKE